ncbi:response regulator [Fibrella aquatilis]|uniref:Response regulator transcription factor n=1 Tax=Fibrella aquatilis TaxID=2817059 RepID=A0A939G1B3_9BACT|nr:response regulator transcription factor [Fibrella aquatilis]MBO0929413.1 response regulator transcription factor [Fibrella aquatilis]
MPIRILLVDDHRIILDSLSMLLSSIDGVEVVAKLSDSREVIPFMTTTPVDVLISDLTMPYLDGVQLTVLVRQAFPNIPVLLLTVSDEVSLIRDAYRAGIGGYVLKKADKSELERALRTVIRGERYFDEAVLHDLLSPATQQSDNQIDPVRLTERELDVIRLIAQEYSTTQIAERLFISAGTVETHRHNIMRKLGIRNMVGILKYALRYQLI